MPTPAQMQNAAIIYKVGRSMGMSSRDIQIGIITAMVESNLTNVNYGDRDSLGLFQQRPSMGWGTPEQVMDPVYASRKFFSTLQALGEARYDMGMGEAAQAVQRSAYPDRYAERIGEMRTFWPELTKAGGDNPKSLDGGDYAVSGSVGVPSALDVPEADLPSMQVPIVTSEGVLSEAYGDLNSSMSPTAKQMLGAWGMGGTNLAPTVDNPVVPQQYATIMPDQLYGEVMPLANPSTNTEIITPMAQTSGGYEKGVDGWRKAFIEVAKTAIGQPYTWGGTSLSSGVDCSGLIYAAFQKIGMSIPRVSYQQANFGTRVGLDQLQPGDLYAWDNSSRNSGADHIAIYLGNGQILEAARPGTTVRIRTLDGTEGGWGVKLNMGK